MQKISANLGKNGIKTVNIFTSFYVQAKHKHITKEEI
jgi:hypothetical protein